VGKRNDQSGDSWSRELSRSRQRLLKVVLPTGGSAFLFSWFMVLVQGQISPTRQFAYIPILGAVMIAAARWVEAFPKQLSWAFVGALFIPIAHSILAAGWTPGMVVILLFLATFSGLLVGKSAAYAQLVAVASVFLVGGLLVQFGISNDWHVRPSKVHPLNAETFSNWVRTSVIFTSFTAASGIGLNRFLSLLGEAARSHSESITRLQQRHALLSATRSERTEKSTGLETTHRFHVVAQLGRGFRRLVGETLTSIDGFLDDMAKAGPADRAQLATQILDSAMDAANRNRHVLALLRPHLQGREEINIGNAIVSIATRFRSRLRRHTVLRVDAALDDSLQVSETWLEQVLLSLLLNAEVATRRSGGVICLQGRKVELHAPLPTSCGILNPGTYAVIRVLDNGKGMTREVAVRAFEPFFSKWPDGSGEHLGLGLTTVFEMMRKAGGTIEIEEPLQGAAVALYLPIATRQVRNSGIERPKETVFAHGWRESALSRLALMAAGAAILGLLVTATRSWVFAHEASKYLLVLSPLILAATFAASNVARYGVRLSVFVATSLVGSLALIACTGFSAPFGIATLSLSIIVVWVLGSQRIATCALAVAACGILAVGRLYSLGLITSIAPTVFLGDSSNWYQVAVALPVLSFVAVSAVLYVVESAQAALAELTALDSKLQSLDRQLAEEVQSLANVEQITSRAQELHELGRMAGTLAHDVNNSLTIVATWADMLAANDTTLPQCDVTDGIAAIKSAVHHAEALLATKGIVAVDPKAKQRIELVQETKEAEQLLQALLAPGQQLEVVTHHTSHIFANSHAYRRALFNLVSNAKDAMSSNGTCRIEVDSAPGHISVAVQDDGAGMDEATRQSVLQPHFTTKGNQGSGLGLQSVVTLMEDCNGRVDVTSAPGQGTRVTLLFPATAEA
jgi:signal transduction histidine kinase